ncbi:type II toxin-antitoxin system VapB family antitoxin [Candidatus Halobeggiatoa sp. HSG11]|nr:type II toxin-antitoxin system VapB family antitoxin [Candidatus Halobeggiatoa sp. HSG11]
MNINLILDDDLIQQAIQLTGLKTPQEVVEIALQKFIAQPDQLSQAFGKYTWEGDLEAMRNDTNVTCR